ncbi:MAG: TonB C-terminal domain-containing protein [Candidatus Babeliales bacterium]
MYVSHTYGTRNTHRNITVAILISLLIHLMIGTAATIHIYFSGAPSSEQTAQFPDLRAAQSSYGASVAFEEIPEQPKTSQTAYPFELPEGNNLTNNNHKTFTEASPQENTATTQTNFDLVEAAHEFQEVAPAIKESKHNAQKTEKKYGLPPKNPFGNGIKKVSPAVQMTLAALAQGFLEHATAQGNDTINSHGSRKADFGDLLYINYFQKVGRKLQDSVRRNNKVFSITRPINDIIRANYVITRDGNIHVQIINPSGIKDLDEFIITALHDAAPFEPFPKSWHDDKIIKQQQFIVNLPQGIVRYPTWVNY